MERLAPDLAQMQRTPLEPEHVEALHREGRIVEFAEGDIIGETGQPMDKFRYILEGQVDVLDPVKRQPFLPHHIGPTQFLGDIAFLSGGVYSLPIQATKPTRAIEVDRETMLRLMSEMPEMSDIVLTVLAARRRHQLELQTSSLLLIGADQDRNIRRILSFAARNKLPYQSIELGSDEAREAASLCGLDVSQPAVIIGKDKVLKDPTPERLAEVMGLGLRMGSDEVFDVLIVGGGPAGVAAAVYAGAEGLKALVIEDTAIGGKAGTSSRIENYMGFPTGISGADLVWRGEVQAMKFGTRFAMPVSAVSLTRDEAGVFCVTTEDEREICARSVVVATGVQYRRLPLENLETLEGAGVYYAATETEARYCKNTDVYVIGGGNSAGQAAMYLSRSAKHVHLLVRGNSLASSMSDYLSSRLEADPRITVHYNTQVSELHGESQLEALCLERQDGTTTHDTSALFIMVGAAPNTDWMSGLIDLDDNGFILTGREVGGRSGFETSCPGIFAVGDVRAASVKRVASAVGEGSVVISKVWEHVNADEG